MPSSGPTEIAPRRKLRLRNRATSAGVLWACAAVAARMSTIFGATLPQEPSAVATPSVWFDAPAYQVDRWETEDGLPENSATAMVQTRDGYLWFGTFNGLVRFDGVRFTVFNQGNLPELPHPAVVNLHLDRRERLWVSTLGGLVVCDGAGCRLVQRAELPEGDYVRTFSERENGDLFLTYYNGRVWEYSQERLKELPPPPGVKDAGYQGAVDEAGQCWVAQHGFVGTWTGGRWQPALLGARIPADPHRAIGLSQARDGGLWLLVDTNLYKVSHGRERYIRSVPNDSAGNLGSVSRMTEDSLGDLWIGTYDAGLTQLGAGGAIRRWGERNGVYRDVRFVFEDREHNRWIGTSGGGLVRMKARRFLALDHPTESGPRLVTSVWPAPQGGVWVASFGQGFFHLDGKGQARWRIPEWPHDSKFFHSVLADRRGRTWVGILGMGLYVFDSAGGQHFPAESVGSENVTSIFEDSRGWIWTAGSGHVAVFRDGAFRRFDAAEGHAPASVCGFAEDSRGQIWVSNLKGVFRLHDDRFVEIQNPAGNPLSGIACLLGDPDGSIWMGSLDRGLLHWRNGEIISFDEQVGIPVRSVYGILTDGQGDLWLASNRGVARVERTQLESVASGRSSNLTCQLLDTSDGLPSAECANLRMPICARDSAGRLWFATTKGVAMIDPDRLRLTQVPLSVIIEEITYRPPASKQAYPAGELQSIVGPFSGPVVLPAGSRMIEIRFTAPSFVAPEKVRFETSLEGHHDGWQRAGAQRNAYFHELPAGDHVFRVRAANHDNVRSDVEATLAFTVQPFLWETLWFRIVAAGVLIGAGALGTQWRHRTVRRRQVEWAERDRQHQAELAHVGRVAALGQLSSSIAHELNQPLGAILRNTETAELMLQGTSFDMEELRAILADIRQDDHRASEVIRRIRSLLKREVFTVAHVDPGTLVSEICRLVQAEARSLGVQLKVEIPSGLPAIAGDRIQLQQVVLNLLLNAFDSVAGRPMGNRQVAVLCELRGAALAIVVADNGHGFTEASRARIFEPYYTTKPNGLGMGLAICRSIVEAHGGSIAAAIAPEGGARFEFTIPLAPAPPPE